MYSILSLSLNPRCARLYGASPLVRVYEDCTLFFVRVIFTTSILLMRPLINPGYQNLLCSWFQVTKVKISPPLWGTPIIALTMAFSFPKRIETVFSFLLTKEVIGFCPLASKISSLLLGDLQANTVHDRRSNIFIAFMILIIWFRCFLLHIH
jgi:hypothetical protein